MTNDVRARRFWLQLCGSLGRQTENREFFTGSPRHAPLGAAWCVPVKALRGASVWAFWAALFR